MRTISFKKGDYQAELDAATGRLVSFRSFGKEMLAGKTQPLLEMRLLDAERKLRALTEEGADIRLSPTEAGCLIGVDHFPGRPGLSVEIRVDALEMGLQYTAKIRNETDCFVEGLCCPCVQVPEKLKRNGGEGKIFWPRAEGALLDQVDAAMGKRLHSLENGDVNLHHFLYPGYVNMQYMAYLTGRDALYLGARDVKGMPKLIVPYAWEEGARLDFRLYPCVAPGETWDQDFAMELRPLQGGWEAAAEIYRAFIEEGQFPLPPKVRENPQMPAWVFDSPLVVIYPPRSVRGTGYMGPNEFFPYVKGLKYLDDIGEDTDSKVMAFLPYWEGTAPWGPPFVWPPFGGEDLFADFVEGMHQRNYLVALYCSGLHWTDEHFLVPDYNRTRYRENHHLTETMCELPDGQLQPGVCETIRTGYTMCCACKPTKDIAYDQFKHILDAQVDYVQYFDQHMGGGTYHCYSKKHGHPGCFGKWSTEEMSEIFHHMNGMIAQDKGEGGALVGAEGAPGDYYCGELYFNDLRWHTHMGSSEPVPAYSYVLHEYTSNFMGNQSGFDHKISRAENPDSLLYALAYSFIAGDALTLVLKSGGEIHYDWGLSWLHPGPRQAPVKKLTRSLNAMRRGPANRFLIGGRMLPTPAFSQPGQFILTRRDGSQLACGEVLSSCWQDEGGEKIQLFVNFRQHDISIEMDRAPLSAFDETGASVPVHGKTAVIPALSCLAFRIE